MLSPLRDPPEAAPKISASLDELERDPYPAMAALRECSPIGWVEALGIWWVVRHEEVQAVLRDTSSFVAGTEHSLVFDTFGEHMLTVDGDAQEKMKRAFRGAFTPSAVRSAMEVRVKATVDALFEAARGLREVELRATLASRLPVLAMLDLFGLPKSEESRLRRLYDAFEAGLSNFTWDEAVREKAGAATIEFHDLMQKHIDRVRDEPQADGLLASVVSAPADERLSDEEIRHNTSIIFFGGISTVDALILNTVLALATNPDALHRVTADRTLLAAAIEETLRWQSPVQSATRHVVRPSRIGEVELMPGDTINCMLGAANRDPRIFPDPDAFVLGRANVKRHLGFAVGPHFCLGSNLAKLEAKIAIDRLLDRCPDLALVDLAEVELRGYEFRQPRALRLRWSDW